VRRRGGAHDLDAVGAIARARGADVAVVGLPVRLDGSEGASARRARSFGEKLRERFTLAVVYWDESFSTVEAERALLEADLSRRRRKQVIDKMAAAVILQSWMDAGAPR
jgi:putative Holliday junction resolvase